MQEATAIIDHHRPLTPVGQLVRQLELTNCTIYQLLPINSEHALVQLQLPSKKDVSKYQFAAWNLTTGQLRSFNLVAKCTKWTSCAMGKGEKDHQAIVAYQDGTSIHYCTLCLQSITQIGLIKTCHTGAHQAKIAFLHHPNLVVATSGGIPLWRHRCGVLSLTENTLRYLPATIKGGDYPDFFDLGEGHVLFVRKDKAQIWSSSEETHNLTLPLTCDRKNPVKQTFRLSNGCFAITWNLNSGTELSQVWSLGKLTKPVYRFDPSRHLLDACDRHLLFYCSEECPVPSSQHTLQLWQLNPLECQGKYRGPTIFVGEPPNQTVKPMTDVRARFIPQASDTLGPPSFLWYGPQSLNYVGNAAAELVACVDESIRLTNPRELLLGQELIEQGIARVDRLIANLGLPGDAMNRVILSSEGDQQQAVLHQLFSSFPIRMQVGVFEWAMAARERLQPCLVELMFNHLTNIALLSFPYSLASCAIREGIGDVEEMKRVLCAGLEHSASLKMVDSSWKHFERTVRHAKRQGYIDKHQKAFLMRKADCRHTFDSAEMQALLARIEAIETRLSSVELNHERMVSLIDRLHASAARDNKSKKIALLLKVTLAIATAATGGTVGFGISLAFGTFSHCVDLSSGIDMLTTLIEHPKLQLLASITQNLEKLDQQALLSKAQGLLAGKVDGAVKAKLASLAAKLNKKQKPNRVRETDSPSTARLAQAEDEEAATTQVQLGRYIASRHEAGYHFAIENRNGRVSIVCTAPADDARADIHFGNLVRLLKIALTPYQTVIGRADDGNQIVLTIESKNPETILPLLAPFYIDQGTQ